MTLVKQRTNSIDLFRYLCAVMVVIIHSSFWYTWGEVGFFLGNIFPRIAVPFFFAISGYFYIKKLEAGICKPFWSQIKHLLIVYAVWSAVYLLIDFNNQVLRGSIPVFSFFREFLISFFIYGSQGHFWFFPAIIIATCLVTLFYKMKISHLMVPISLTLYVIGCLGCSYYEIGIKIPVLGTVIQSSHFETIRRILLMGFPFFCAGAVVLKLERLSSKCVTLLFLLSAAVFVAEIYLVTYFEISANIILTFGLYFLLIFTLQLLFRNPLPQCKKSAAAARTIANFTYYSHPLFQYFIPKAAAFFGFEIPAPVLFFLTIAITFSLGMLCHVLIAKKNFKIIKHLVG